MQLKKFYFGRSMLEMLGVLAIIGVLSIGGLAAYRYAIERYHINQFLQFANQVHLLGNEGCLYADNCPAFGVGAQNYAKNRDFICAQMGNNPDYCGTVNDVAPIKYFSGSYWMIYNAHYSSRDNVYLQVMGLKEWGPKVCKAILNSNMPLDSIKIGTHPSISSANGQFSPEQKQTLLAQCDVAQENYQIALVWFR